MAATTADPALKNKLAQVEKDLNSILNKWNFGAEKITSASQFLAKFAP
jgi:hypothetical protein